MKLSPRQTGVLLLAVHLALVSLVGSIYAYERATLPRVWAKVLWFKGTGGYINVRACPVMAPYGNTYRFPVRLKVTSEGLVAEPGSASDKVEVLRDGTQKVPCLSTTTPLYTGDSDGVPVGTELWAEFSIPPNGAPRPLRLGIKGPSGIEPYSPRDRQ
jgi:hypothetical protein